MTAFFVSGCFSQKLFFVLSVQENSRFFKNNHFTFFYTTDGGVSKLEGTTTIKKESKNMLVLVCKIFLTTGQI
jgi:hypothetical protein